MRSWLITAISLPNSRYPFSCEADLPASLPVSDVDLCVILGNLMENAIQGSLTIPAAERIIHLSIDMESKELYILLTNRFDGFIQERDGRILSSGKRVTASAFPQSGLPQKNITVWPALNIMSRNFPPASC